MEGEQTVQLYPDFEEMYIRPVMSAMKKDLGNVVRFYIGIDTMMCPLDDRRVFE